MQTTKYNARTFWVTYLYEWPTLTKFRNYQPPHQKKNTSIMVGFASFEKDLFFSKILKPYKNQIKIFVHQPPSMLICPNCPIIPKSWTKRLFFSADSSTKPPIWDPPTNGENLPQGTACHTPEPVAPSPKKMRGFYVFP